MGAIGPAPWSRHKHAPLHGAKRRKPKKPAKYAAKQPKSPKAQKTTPAYALQTQKREENGTMEIIITEFGTKLGKNGERFTIKRSDANPVEIPAEDVEAIIITGKGVAVSTDAITLALEHNIPIILLTFSGEPYAHIVPPSSLGNAALRLEQLRALDDGRGATLGAAMLTGKLRNQAANLRYFAKSRQSTMPDIFTRLRDQADAIDQLSSALNLCVQNAPQPVKTENVRAALMNIEAKAARHYWAGVALILPDDIQFPGRDRRNAQDPFNCCLNYAYAILYGRLNPIIIITGLDPYVGYIHTLEDKKAALLFDFIEEFRQFVVDRTIISAFTKKWRPQFEQTGRLDTQTRKFLAARILDRLDDTVEWQNKHVRILDLIKAKSYEIARFLRGEDTHNPYVAPW